MTSPLQEHQERATYVTGYVLALVFTGCAFGVVWLHLFAPGWCLGVVLGLAFLQVLVHLRCFLHIDLTRSARDDLHLILFSSVIIMLMVGGTLVILFNLRARMM